MTRKPEEARQFLNEEVLLDLIGAGDAVRLAEAIIATPRLAKLSNKVLRTAWAHRRFDPVGGANWVITEAAASGARSALDQLRKLAWENKVVVRNFWALYGIAIGHDVELGYGFRLLTVDPALIHSQLFVDPKWLHHWSARFPQHNVVLTRQIDASYTTSEEIPSAKAEELYKKARREHEESALTGIGLLTLTTGDLVASGADWTIVMPDRNSNGGRAAGHMPNQVPTHPMALSASQVARAQQLFGRFYALQSRQQRAVAYSLGAYQRAIGALHPFEGALLLAVGIETLLMEGEKGESLATRFALRGSWLIADGYDARKDAHDTLRKLYSLRSDLAHNGGMSADETLGQLSAVARRMYVQMVTRILEKGYPDWNELILGGNGWSQPPRQEVLQTKNETPPNL